MQKQRNVFLFGAGAVIEWNAPTTNQLTKLVRQSGFKTTDNKTTITEFIYRQLTEGNTYENCDVNFETIINVIEELIVYYSDFNATKKLPSIPHIIFTSKFEDDLLNFSVEGGEVEHGFKLEIPKGKLSEFANRAINDETPEQFFFQQLLAEILTDIVARITKYSYHNEGGSYVMTNDNKQINELFSNWIKQVNGTNILRMYSLNYDRNFKIILEKLDATESIFEGFDCSNTLEYGSNSLPNIPKILSDADCDVYYNLHGSVFWEVEARDTSQLPNPSFTLTERPVLQVNSYEQAIWQSEKGKTIMLTNIITGFQKTQRGIFPPFKQMQSAFDRDCCFANNIYIVGYSFGDEHINASLKTAIQYNRDLKIIIIDPSFTKEDFDLDVAIKIFSCAGDMHNMNPTTVTKNLHSFFDGKFIVHTTTFKEYLQRNI